MKRLLLLTALCTSCGFANVQGCPPKTAAVTSDCKTKVANGQMSKDECYRLIEESCP